MSKIIALVIFSLVLFVTAPSILWAGVFSENLRESIADKGEAELVRVLIVPVSDHNSAVFKRALTETYSTMADRHRYGIADLKASAQRSQPEIVDALARLQSAGFAGNVKPYWIANIIEAEVAVGELENLIVLPSIDKIELYPEITSIPMVPVSPSDATAMGLPGNLRAVKADSAWAAGYDGRGRIICSFDTGVDGFHPALSGNYRGNKGYPASQCWFSPVDSSTYPHVFSLAASKVAHGTHTAGIMVGHDDITGDTIGVAPGADWISAVAVDVPGASVFEAFQWAADPDGDPNTVSDVPDVINHSWGVQKIGCADVFWDAIDNLEALGVVNIFAAGNEGSAAGSIRNPANRFLDSLTNFAVGALRYDYSSIWSASSRGPSTCGIIATKPNVAAPGEWIRSAIPEGFIAPDSFYAKYSGTSGAAPHVSGAVAILRQKNPDATVDEIKAALLSSAHDLGPTGPDNSFGWGAIDIMEALRRIEYISSPLLQLLRFDHPDVYPGDTIHVDVALKNAGAAINGVEAVFANPEDGLTLLTDQIKFGHIGRDAVVEGSSPLDLVFDDSVEPGRVYSLDMTVTGDGGYTKDQRLSVLVGAKGVPTYFHHNTGRVRFTISNYGAFGFAGTTGTKGLNGSFVPLGFEGYRLDRDTNDLYQAALLIGVDSCHVSDCAVNVATQMDNDFAVVPGGSIVASTPGPVADQETVSMFDDHYAENPIGVTIRQRTFAWTQAPDNSFIILEFILTNTSPMAVNGIRVGLFLDWDIRAYGQNRGSFLPGEDIGYLCWAYGDDSADFRGVKALNAEGLLNHRIYTNWNEVNSSNFTEGRKYSGLTDDMYGSIPTSLDVSHVTATGPFNLDVMESDTAAFAIIGGADWNSFMESAVRAQQKYNDFPTAVDGEFASPVPGSFILRQNYPNPFNPATSISLSIPQADRVRVDIYDILGRLVRTLCDDRLPAGTHAFAWDGATAAHEPAASGIYFTRARYGNSAQTCKMLLIK